MCGYCGCESIGVIGRFMREHVEIINASGVLRRAAETADAAPVREAVAALRGLLDPHTGAEEAGLFAMLAQDPEFTDHVIGLCAEHVILDDLLGRVEAGAHDLVPTLERALRAHIDREENGLFPAAAIVVAGLEWEQVAALTPAPAGVAAWIVVREILGPGLRLAAVERGVVLGARDLGRVKTWAQAVAATIAGLAAAGAWRDDVAWWALLAALIATWVSGLDYARVAPRVLRGESA